MSFVLPSGQHRFTDVHVMDEPGAGGAYHEYQVRDAKNPIKAPYAQAYFQKGPVKENEINGIFIEDLLTICQHRLECFQAGDFACRENEKALAKIQEALFWLDSRTKKRQQRGVEGTSKL
jgi:hypothetical protein